MTATDRTDRQAAPVESADLEQCWICHAPALLRLATVMAGPDDAHDLVVNAFLRSTDSPVWAQVANQRAYLYRALASTVSNHRRERERRWRRDLAAVHAGAVDPREPDPDVLRAIAALSPEQRAVVYLAYWEDMTEAAVAEHLGLSTGTVHRNLTRARDRLREVLR